MNSDNPYNLSDDARLCLLQARFETLHQGGRQLGPAHLVLGVLRHLAHGEQGALLSAEQFEAVCTALGATLRPAPLSTVDISYDAAAEEAMGGAIAAGRDRDPESMIEPLHLLLGVLEPRRLVEQTATQPSAVATVLTGAGLDAARLRALLDPPSGQGRTPA